MRSQTRCHLGLQAPQASPELLPAQTQVAGGVTSFLAADLGFSIHKAAHTWADGPWWQVSEAVRVWRGPQGKSHSLGYPNPVGGLAALLPYHVLGSESLGLVYTQVG